MRTPTKKGNLMDENLTYLSETGEVLAYRSGEDGDTYHALALVKSGDEFMVWHYSKSFDYDTIKPKYKHGMSEERLMEEDYRHDVAMTYDPDRGCWESYEDEHEARAAYDDLSKSVGRLRPMEVSEVEELLDNVMRYKGQPYSAWEPNY